MPPPDDRANGRSPPYSRRYDRASGSISRNSREERGPEERRSDDRPSHPSPNNSTARLPSGSRGSASMTRPPLSIQERTSIGVVGSKPGMNSSTERGPDQILSPATKQTMGFPAPDGASTRSPNAEAYKEVLNCLSIFTKQVTENTKLAFEKDKAEKSYLQKKAVYEKTQNHHTNYPHMSEQQQKSNENARIQLKRIEELAQAKQQDMTQTMQSLAHRIVSGGVDTGAIDKSLQKVQSQLNDLEKRLNDESLGTRKLIAALDQDLHHNFPNSETFKKELFSIQKEINIAKAAAANSLGSEVIRLRQEMPNTSKLQQELGPLRQQIGTIDREVKLAREENRILDQQIQQVKKNDAKWEQNHNLVLGHEAFIKTLDSQQQNSESVRKEVVELRQRASALEDKTAKLHVGDHKRVTEDITGLRRRIDVLESRPSRAPSVTSSTARSGPPMATVTEEYSVKMEELSSAVDLLRTDFEQLQTNISVKFDKFQEDNDDVYGNAVDEVKTQVSLLNAKFASLTSNMETMNGRTTSLEGSFSGLRHQHNENLMGLSNSQAQQGIGLQQLQKEVQALKVAQVAPRPVELSSNYPSNQATGYGRQISSPVVSSNSVPGRQSGSPVVNSSDLVQSNFKTLTDRIEALTMGVSQLQTRFNSLTTDALARQMWSQLDNVHPHLKDATKGLDKMTHTIHALELQLPQLRQKIDTLEQRNQSGLPPGLADALERVDRNVTAIGHRVDQADQIDHSLQKQIDLIVKNQGNALSNQSNGISRREGSSSDSGAVKRKAPDATNGNAKRAKTSSRRIVQDTDDEESQGNVNSDALSPTPR